MTTRTVARFTFQPLVRQQCAEFATPEGTRYQILWVKDWDGIRFSVLSPVSGQWSPVRRFGYAEAWQQRTGNYSWTPKLFRAMVSDFLAECDES